MSAQATTAGNVTLVTQTVQNVRAVDGRILQVVGAFSATVVPRNLSYAALDFASPVEASVDGLNLNVAGGNRAQVQFPLNEVDYVEIATFDGGLTSLIYVIVGLALGGIAAGVTLALIQ